MLFLLKINIWDNCMQINNGGKYGWGVGIGGRKIFGRGF